MSINVTVHGNPVSIRRGKMVLSDLENLKKTEREHRKRLRLEQVHEQSKALSKTLLERAKQIRQEQLDRLEKCGNTEMKKARDKKLMELHSRYQDIENIGYAHENAARQPNVDYIKEAEEISNKQKAKERELEALERMKESQKKVSPHTKHVERLRSVRELENERSNMVSHLPKNLAATSKTFSESVEPPSTTKSKNAKYVVCKKTPIRQPKISLKPPSKRSESIPNKNKTLTTNSCKDKNIISDINKHNTDLEKINPCDSDENEPRKMAPKTGSNKPKTVIRIEKKNSNLTSSSTTSSSSISEDSSYFSDNASKSTVAKKAVRQHASSAVSKVTSYDHETRHKYTYDVPTGLVERTNEKNKPNAHDLAQEMVNLENQVSDVVVTQEETPNQRCQDALLREKIRRDYKTLLKKLEELERKEKKYEAQQCSTATNQRLSAPCKRSENSTNRQRKMDRVMKNILQSSRQPPNTNLIDRTERPITLQPLESMNPKPMSTSRYRAFFSDDEETDESPLEDDNDYSRKRRISELLIKIEKMKRRLLQEYGTDLPNEIFNASVKSLFNNQSTVTEKRRVESKSLRPTFAPEHNPKEMKNLNAKCASMCSKVISKQPQKIISKTKNVSTKTPAKNFPNCSTNKNPKSTCDQQTQVTLEQETNDKEVETNKQYPLEPLVKITTPNKIDSHSSSSICSSNSSCSTDVVIGVSKKELTIISKDKKKNMKVSKNTRSVSSVQSTTKTPVKICFDEKNGSGSYQIVGLVIDTSMKEITVIPKKTKLSTESRDTSPVITGNCHSLPGSRANSPTKKLSASAPPSRHSSPKKSPQSNPRVIKDEAASNKQRKFKTQYTQVSNSSTESSQLNSSETSNFYRFQALASKRIITQFQDTSDASTAYPSPLGHGILNASDNTNTILEFLDSSTNESIKKRLHDVSPVSSPETPSPRTMMVPSNVPRPGKASKSLKFTSLINSQTHQGSSRASKNNRPCSTQPTTFRPILQTRPSKKDDSQTTILKYCPEVLKKYEDMQNVCAGRIASLTDLIQQVRNEQKGLELSVMTSKDSNSASQIISNSQLSSNGDINQIVKNVESISTQLKKTLMDSRQIIAGEGIKICEPLKSNKDKLPRISKNTSSISDSPEEKININQPKSSTVPPPKKPKITCNERVNIDLDRFKPVQKSKRTSGGSDAVKSKVTSLEVIAAAGPTSNSSDQNEDVVKMLSNEILEQSKTVNKSSTDILKNSDQSSFKSSQPAVNDSEELNRIAVDNQENDSSENLNSDGPEFVPFLAGIPKISRTKGSASGRGRPPVTLISGPYRQEMDLNSPVHELSTIVEFDTPDTAKKSQTSTRSPSNKARKKLPTTDSNQSSPSKKTDSNVTKFKPSVHVAPLPTHRSPQLSLNLSNKSGTKSFEKSPRNSSKKSAEKSSETLESKKAIKSILKKSNSSDSMHSLPDVFIENLQTSRENTDVNNYFRISQISELHSLPDENIDQMLVSEVCEESVTKTTPKKKRDQVEEKKQDQPKKQDKPLITSTSTTDFSGLSGVSEITTSPSSDLNSKCLSSPEEMEQALKKWGIGGWANALLKKTREASALGSSSSSDGTPVNTGTRLVSPFKKQNQDGASHDLPAEISDVSSISMKHANKSTEKSVLVKGRTSTPNMLEKNETQDKFSVTNSDGTVSTLGSFSSDLNIVADNQSADITVPNISFSNCKL